MDNMPSSKQCYKQSFLTIVTGDAQAEWVFKLGQVISGNFPGRSLSPPCMSDFHQEINVIAINAGQFLQHVRSLWITSPPLSLTAVTGASSEAIFMVRFLHMGFKQ